jgi:hypothetical protein
MGRIHDADPKPMFWKNKGLADFAMRVGGGFAAQQLR